MEPWRNQDFETSKPPQVNAATSEGFAAVTLMVGSPLRITGPKLILMSCPSFSIVWIILQGPLSGPTWDVSHCRDQTLFDSGGSNRPEITVAVFVLWLVLHVMSSWLMWEGRVCVLQPHDIPKTIKSQDYCLYFYQHYYKRKLHALYCRNTSVKDIFFWKLWIQI